MISKEEFTNVTFAKIYKDTVTKESISVDYFLTSMFVIGYIGNNFKIYFMFYFIVFIFYFYLLLLLLLFFIFYFLFFIFIINIVNILFFVFIFLFLSFIVIIIIFIINIVNILFLKEKKVGEFYYSEDESLKIHEKDFKNFFLKSLNRETVIIERIEDIIWTNGIPILIYRTCFCRYNLRETPVHRLEFKCPDTVIITACIMQEDGKDKEG